MPSPFPMEPLGTPLAEKNPSLLVRYDKRMKMCGKSLGQCNDRGRRWAGWGVITPHLPKHSLKHPPIHVHVALVTVYAVSHPRTHARPPGRPAGGNYSPLPRGVRQGTGKTRERNYLTKHLSLLPLHGSWQGYLSSKLVLVVARHCAPAEA